MAGYVQPLVSSNVLERCTKRELLALHATRAQHPVASIPQTARLSVTIILTAVWGVKPDIALLCAVFDCFFHRIEELVAFVGRTLEAATARDDTGSRTMCHYLLFLRLVLGTPFSFRRTVAETSHLSASCLRCALRPSFLFTRLARLLAGPIRRFPGGGGVREFLARAAFGLVALIAAIRPRMNFLHNPIGRFQILHQSVEEFGNLCSVYMAVVGSVREPQHIAQV